MARFVDGNDIQLLCTGQEFFPALIAAIDGARESVYLETYIFNDDVSGRSVAGALSRAAQRRVTVCVTVDGFGTRDFPIAIRDELRAAGVKVTIFRPDKRMFHISKQRLRRMHRKLALVDGRIAFVGGINMIDDFVDLNHGVLDEPRFDFSVQIRGPLVRPIAQTMLAQWLRLNWRQMVDPSAFGRKLMAVARQQNPPPAGNMRAAFVMRDNFRHRNRIEYAYLAAIAVARADIIVSNAYFFPGHRFRRALVKAAKRGVRVRLLLQGRTEYLLQHHATQALYDELIRAGIEVWEYRKSFLHAKVAVVDDHWATVGSSNIDPFSLLLAREANVIVRDAGFVGQLRDKLEGAIRDDSARVAAVHCDARPWYIRGVNWFAYGVIRLGILLTGRAGRY